MTQEQCDVIIIGAGLSGIHQFIQLRQRGLRCIIIEAGSEFGGSWYWNTYPGARVDNPIPTYELSLPELWKDWTWTQKFPGQRELQAYFRYAGDKMSLRPHCRFDTVVKQARWDNQLHLWVVTSEGKHGLYKASARHLILCMGVTFKRYIPDIKGREMFKGQSCHTSQWPKEGIEMTGKRVGVIGTGSSGVQVIQDIGPQVAHLTVFQRDPNLALPMQQCNVSKQVQDHFKPVYEELFKKLSTTFGGTLGHFIPRPMLSDTKEEREANFERIWEMGGFDFVVSNYQDFLLDRTSNAAGYAFWRRKVIERVRDSNKRDLLAPEVQPYPFASKRPSMEQNYYEIFNQDNVDLIDLKTTPVLEINESGLRTTNKHYELDVLIFATGFDNYVGSFNDIDLRGLDGISIQEHWKNGVTTYLGMTIDNFPNLFFVNGPHGPTAFCNAPTCTQVQGMWVAETISYLCKNRITKFTPTTHAAMTFKKHVNELCDATLIGETDSWYMGANIPGKKREVYNYLGGLVAYTREIRQEVESGYPNFLRDALGG